MNTKILLAIAGAVALSACGRNKAILVEEFPLVPSQQPRARPANPAAPPSRGPTRNPGFRLPDPTRDLYPLRTTGNPAPQPSPKTGDPLSVVPPTPPPERVVPPSE